MFEPPRQIAAVLRNFAPQWFVAGGWAIDLFVGRETRPHNDIEIAVFRRDQMILREHLSEWIFKKASDGALHEWKKEEFLQPPIHEIHCFEDQSAAPILEVLLNETDGKNWVYRRDARISKPLAEIALTSKNGIRFLCPEIVLLYKSKKPREKDEQDFQTILPLLAPDGRRWLKNALAIFDARHPWLKKLS